MARLRHFGCAGFGRRHPGEPASSAARISERSLGYLPVNRHLMNQTNTTALPAALLEQRVEGRNLAGERFGDSLGPAPTLKPNLAVTRSG